jgi:predicted ATPase
MATPDIQTLPAEYQRLLELAQERFHVEILLLDELRGGRTGALLYLVSVAPTSGGAAAPAAGSLAPETGQPVRHLILKLDRIPQRAAADEIEQHKRALSLAPPDFARRHIAELAYEVRDGEQMAVFYAIAGQSLLQFRPLAHYARQSQLETLFRATHDVLINRWNAPPAFDRGVHPQKLLERWLSYRLKPGGRISDFLEQRCGMDAGTPGFVIRGEVYPNPLAFGRDPGLWGKARPIDVLTGCQHGDLNTRNILARFAADGRDLDGYYLIDFVLFKPGMPLFFDPRYLEMSYLFDEIDKVGLDPWVDLVTGYAREDTPDPQHAPVGLAGACAVLGAGRRAFREWVEAEHASLCDDLWGQFWLAGAAAGLNFCNKQGVGDRERLAGMIFAAAHLKRFCSQFGVAAPAEVKLLYDGARAWEAADLRQDSPARRTLNAIPNNLPVQLTSFIGREQEVAEVRRHLGETRLLTLTGAGGAGKTRLALQAAQGLSTEFADGVWWVELAPLSDPALVPQAIGAPLGLRDEANRPMLDQLRDHLRTKRLLLVLDNCEHLVAACAVCADALLHAAPGLRILATSREPLAIAGETTYRVPSLETPDTAHLPPPPALAQVEAVRLFVERGAAVLPGFAVTQGNAAAIAEICRRLDGIPLAIELAAARIKVLPVEELRARLGDRFRVLTSGSRMALPRQRTLRATMDWSWDLLAEAERILLRRLAVFAGGWTLDAAESVCAGDDIPEEQVLDTLAGLVDKSLVILDCSGERGRYRMLETVRQYATERLAESGEADRVRQRHAGHFLGFTERAEPELYGPEQDGWLARLEDEHSNLRAALEWLAASGAAEQGLRLAGALWRFWEVHGHLGEGRTSLAEMLRLAGPDADPAARAKALLGAGGCAYYMRDHPAATRLWEESLRLHRAVGGRQGEARVLIYQGWLANDTGQFAEARRLYEEGLAICREIGDRQGTAWALARLGIAWHWEGESAAGLPLLEQGLALSREINDKLGIAQWTYLLAQVQWVLGDLSAAKALMEESVPLCRELGDRRDLGFCLELLGLLMFSQGDRETGLGRMKEGVRLFCELGDPMGISGALCCTAITSVGEAKFVRAHHLAGAAQALDEASGLVWPVSLFGMVGQALEAARGVLGAEAAYAAWMQGRTMPLEQAIAEALEE